MLRNKLVRSDGSIIDSSVIISCEFTEEVNAGTNLSVGDATASELTIEVRGTDVVRQNDVLTYYIIEDGVETKIGVFNAEKPTVASRTSMRFSAYDNIVKTEKVFSDWLRENQSLFPMTLYTLVRHACSYCGVTFSTASFPRDGLSINAFYADDLTCRQILMWASAIAGRFVRANTNGELEFAWYADSANIMIRPNKEEASNGVLSIKDDGAGNISIESSDITVLDDGEGNITLETTNLAVLMDETGFIITGTASKSIPYIQGSLNYENYSTDLIERVQINHSEDDVGVIYPAENEGNCFTISENMILGVLETTDVSQVAEAIYNQLKYTSYVPFSVTIPKTIRIRAGDTVSVLDSNGYGFTSLVMKVTAASGGTTITTTGDKSYGSNAAVSSEKYKNLTGKVLRISKSIDGLAVTAEDLEGKVGSLELSTESFKTYVKDTYISEEEFGEYRNDVSSEFKQTADGFTMQFENVKSSVDVVTKDVEKATRDIENLDRTLENVQAHIRSGVLDYEGDSPVYGIEVGQRTEIDGVETFNKYARFTSDKLSFFDSGGQEVAYIGDQRMHITHAEITDSQKLGGFVDTVLSDGSVITKWVGGVS